MVKKDGLNVAKDFEFENGVKPCPDLINQELVSTFVTYGIALFISVLNGVLRVFLKEVSGF